MQNGIHIVAPVARIPSLAFQVPRQGAPQVVHNGHHQSAAPSMPYLGNQQDVSRVSQIHHQQTTGQLSSSLLSQGTTRQSVSSGLTPISSQVEYLYIFENCEHWKHFLLSVGRAYKHLCL